MKNRVAAQTARDRKKELMDNMELKLAKQSKEVATLNRKLAICERQLTALFGKNAELKQKISNCTCNCSELPNSRVPNPQQSHLELEPETLIENMNIAINEEVKTPVSDDCTIIESAALDAMSQQRTSVQSAEAAALWVLVFTIVAYLSSNNNSHSQKVQLSAANKRLLKSSLQSLPVSIRNKLCHLLKSSDPSSLKHLLRKLMRCSKLSLPNRLLTTTLSHSYRRI